MGWIVVAERLYEMRWARQRLVICGESFLATHSDSCVGRLFLCVVIPLNDSSASREMQRHRKLRLETRNMQYWTDGRGEEGGTARVRHTWVRWLMRDVKDGEMGIEEK
jgi:hypothetical protein